MASKDTRPEFDRFRELLLKKHGNFLLAWRTDMDRDGDWRLSFHEFCTAATNVGYSGDIHSLWCEMDKTGPSEVTLEDIDADTFKLLERFRSWCVDSFGGIVDAFAALDVDRNIILTKAEFIGGCTENGFDATPAELASLYKGFDLDGRGGVTALELLFLEMNPARRKLFRPVAETVVGRQRLRVRAARKERDSLTAFRKLLIKRFGSIPRAWRLVIDVKGQMKISRNDLFVACKSIDFHGDVRALWRCLNADDPHWTSLEMLDPSGAEMLALFGEWFYTKFGGAQNFIKTLDPDGRKHVHLKQFQEGLNRLGFLGPVRKLFSALDVHGVGYIKTADLSFYSTWVPPAWLTAQPDHRALHDFKILLLSTYGNYVKAWRTCLDMDSSNRVTWLEFVHATTQTLGMDRNLVPGIWRALDEDMSGYITLNELDEQSHSVLVKFKKWAETNFGNVECCFKSIDKDNNNNLTLQEFLKAAVAYDFDGNVRAMFDCLDTEGRRMVSLHQVAFLDDWDLGEDTLNSIHTDKNLKAEKRLESAFVPRVAQVGLQQENHLSRTVGRTTTDKDNKLTGPLPSPYCRSQTVCFPGVFPRSSGLQETKLFYGTTFFKNNKAGVTMKRVPNLRRLYPVRKYREPSGTMSPHKKFHVTRCYGSHPILPM